MEESRLIENSLRKRRNYLKNQSKHACHIERRVEHEMKKVVQNLEPPFKKPFRSTKLRRYRIKKPAKPVEIQDKKLSERDKFYFHAFQEDSYI